MVDDSERVIATLVANFPDKRIIKLIERRLEGSRNKIDLDNYQNMLLIEQLADGMIYATAEIIRLGETSNEAIPFIKVLNNLQKSLKILLEE